MKKKLRILDTEFTLISEIIEPIKDSDALISKCIQTLKEELNSAEIFTIDKISDEVVRLNSIVDVETPFGELKVQLVLPENSNSLQKKLSLLTPMGSAIFGYSIGDFVEWQFPNGEHLIKIINVCQSEFD